MLLYELFKKLYGKETVNDKYMPSEPKANTTSVGFDLNEPERYYFPQDENDIAFLKTSVAGITRHMKMADARKTYQGHTVFEPDNPVDKKAVKFVTDDGKMIGYIPKKDQSLYYSIFDGKDGIRFYGAVGIFTNDQNKKTLFGKVMVVDIPDPDEGDRFFNIGQKQLDFMMRDFTTE